MAQVQPFPGAVGRVRAEGPGWGAAFRAENACRAARAVLHGDVRLRRERAPGGVRVDAPRLREAGSPADTSVVKQL